MNTRQLRLITTQKYETHENTDEMLIDAIVAERNGSTYITFKQKLEEHNVEVSNMVKIKDNRIQVKRSGALKSDLTFDIAKSCNTEYETPYGLLDLCVNTQSIESFILQEHVNVKICYEMIMQGKKISDNIYMITSAKEEC